MYQVAGQHGTGASDAGVAANGHRLAGGGLFVDEGNHPARLLHCGRREIGHRLEHVHQVGHALASGGNGPLFHPYNGADALGVEKEQVVVGRRTLRTAQLSVDNPTEVHVLHRAKRSRTSSKDNDSTATTLSRAP